MSAQLSPLFEWQDGALSRVKFRDDRCRSVLVSYEVADWHGVLHDMASADRGDFDEIPAQFELHVLNKCDRHNASPDCALPMRNILRSDTAGLLPQITGGRASVFLRCAPKRLAAFP